MTYAVRKTYIEEKISKLAEKNNLQEDEAFLRYVYSVLFNRNIDDIDEEDIIEGSQEKQIDIIKIEEEQEKQFTLHIVQCKNDIGFSSNSIIGLNNGLKWIFEKSKKDYEKLKNINLLSKIKEIRGLLDENGYSNVALKIYYICKGDSGNLSDEFKQEQKSLEEWKSLDFKSFNLYIWGSVEFVDYLNRMESTQKIINENIKLVYDINRPSVIQNMIEQYKGIICSVKASEIARLIKKDEEGVIFNKNIRKFLGEKKKINKSIYETCTDSKESRLFWFYNNGITMVCDTAELHQDPDNPHIKVTNLQIVNGCQTSVTLFNAMEKGELKKDSAVLVKVFATIKEDSKFVDMITLTTNNQNKIGLRDLKANDSIQIDIEKVLLEKYNYYYERKINQYKDKKIDSRSKINNEKMAQSYLAFGKKMPSVARSRPNTIWENEDIYDELFRKSTPARLLFSYKLYDYCNTIKKEKMEVYKVDENLYSTVAYGIFHIVRIIGFLFLNSESFPSDKELDDKIKEIEKNPDLLYKYYERAVKILNKILEINSDRFTSPNNFYKSNEIQVIINKELNKKAESIVIDDI